MLMYSIELHPDLPIFPTNDPGPSTKRGSQALSAAWLANTLPLPFPLKTDANPNGPANYSRQLGTPGPVVGGSQRGVGKASSVSVATTGNQDQSMRESSVDSIPPSWPKVGQGCLAGLDIKEDDLRDKNDFEAFSVTTYDPKGKKTVENGVPVDAQENSRAKASQA